MAKARRILSRSLLVAGMSGFPVGIASFVKNSRFEAQKLYPILDEINKEEAFLAEYRQEKQTIENTTKPEIETINGLQAELASENKTASDGIGAQTKSVSEELKKAMMVKLQPCTEKDKLGLKEISKTFEVQNQTISITYCYFPECDQNLFSNKSSSFSKISYDSEYIEKWFSRACYSAIIKHDESAKKITGSIQLALKHDFSKNNQHKLGWRGVLFATEFEFSADDKNNDKFKNRLIILKKDGGEWKDYLDYKDWDDTYKSKYTYDYLKDKLTNGYSKLEYWEEKSNSSREFASREDPVITNFFDKDSDLWRWNSFQSKQFLHHRVNFLENHGKEIIKWTRWNKYGVWMSLSV